MSSDIEKLRPELLNKSVAELERRKAEIDLAIAEVAKKEAAEKRAGLVTEANERREQFLSHYSWLHDNEFLPKKFIDAATDTAGRFSPAKSFREIRG